MQKTMEEIKDICKIKEALKKAVLCLVETDEGSRFTTEEGGEWIDMLKDCYEMEEKAWKSCYYKLMAMGLQPPTEEEAMQYRQGPFGYDNWRYKSSGHYAPKGHGEYSAGFMMDEEIYAPNQYDVYGYEGSMKGPTRISGAHMNGMNSDMRHGQAYNAWKSARRHYTQTGSAEDRMEMDQHSKEHVMDAVTSIKEMYMAGDPELKKEIKKHLTNLVGDMPT